HERGHASHAQAKGVQWKPATSGSAADKLTSVADQIDNSLHSFQTSVDQAGATLNAIPTLGGMVGTMHQIDPIAKMVDATVRGVSSTIGTVATDVEKIGSTVGDLVNGKVTSVSGVVNSVAGVVSTTDKLIHDVGDGVDQVGKVLHNLPGVGPVA